MKTLLVKPESERKYDTFGDLKTGTLFNTVTPIGSIDLMMKIEYGKAVQIDGPNPGYIIDSLIKSETLVKIYEQVHPLEIKEIIKWIT